MPATADVSSSSSSRVPERKGRSVTFALARDGGSDSVGADSDVG